MRALLHGLRDSAIRTVAGLTRAPYSGSGDSVLIIQPDHIGDILLSQPAAQHIRHRFPNCKLVAVVGPWSEAIARRCWPVDEVVTIPFPAYDRSQSAGNMLAPYLTLKQAATTLRALNPRDVFILRPDDWWSAWLASMIGSKRIVTARDKRMDPFATEQVEIEHILHASQRALAIAAGNVAADLVCSPRPAEFPLHIPVVQQDAEAARALLAERGILTDYVVIHPGSGADVKLWPMQRWRHVARQLACTGMPVIVTGSNQEVELARQIACGIDNVQSIAGQTTLSELIEVLRSATLVAGPDCGPLHLAVGCGTPTLHLFGPSDSAKFGPWGDAGRQRVVSADWSCAQCGNLSATRPAGCGCMLAIETAVVLETVTGMVQQHVAH